MLEAAKACVLAVGVRRTTFSDVARRAGVSRMTLYRRFPDLETLLSTLMTWEFGRVATARGPAVRPPARRGPGAAAALRDRPAGRDAADGGRGSGRGARGRLRRRLRARRRPRDPGARDRAARTRVRARPRPGHRRVGGARPRGGRIPAAMTGASLNAARRAAELEALA